MQSTLNGNYDDLELSDPHQFLLSPALYVHSVVFLFLFWSKAIMLL